METTSAAAFVDYTEKLNSINTGITATYTLLYILIVCGALVLLYILFYKFLRIFI